MKYPPQAADAGQELTAEVEKRSLAGFYVSLFGDYLKQRRSILLSLSVFSGAVNTTSPFFQCWLPWQQQKLWSSEAFGWAGPRSHTRGIKCEHFKTVLSCPSTSHPDARYPLASMRWRGLHIRIGMTWSKRLHGVRWFTKSQEGGKSGLSGMHTHTHTNILFFAQRNPSGSVNTFQQSDLYVVRLGETRGGARQSRGIIWRPEMRTCWISPVTNSGRQHEECVLGYKLIMHSLELHYIWSHLAVTVTYLHFLRRPCL